MSGGGVECDTTAAVAANPKYKDNRAWTGSALDDPDEHLHEAFTYFLSHFSAFNLASNLQPSWFAQLHEEN